jgi:hypothetical protein
MTDTVTCPACGTERQSMDHLVDHISDEHGWTPAIDVEALV